MYDEDLNNTVNRENVMDISDNSVSNSNSIDSPDEDSSSNDSDSDENSNASVDSSNEDRSSYNSNSEYNSESNCNEEQEHLQFANDNERGQYVVKILRDWIQEGGIMSMRKLDSLLAKFHRMFPNVPLSYKTFLQTPDQIDINQINGGELWFKGIGFNLDLINLEEYLRTYNKILIDINIDGLPLFKSSSQRFWPILGKLIRSKSEPFIITIFKGSQDFVMDDLLNDFVKKIADLYRNGYIRNSTSYRFSIRYYILDAPARSKVKCCIEHGGYCACEKCEIVGEYVDNRMTYVELNEILRTDQSFLNQEQPYHHIGRSRLEVIGAGLVSQFCLDSLHLVYLGVFND